MPYVPPALRKKEEKPIVIDPTSEKDFPVLGLSVSSKKVEGNLFAAKAREWEDQRREHDYRMKQEEERAALLKIQKEREADEYAIMFPEKKEKVVEIREEVVVEEEVKSEWTTVRKPPRREPRAKVDFNTNPEDEVYSDDELMPEWTDVNRVKRNHFLPRDDGEVKPIKQPRGKDKSKNKSYD